MKVTQLLAVVLITICLAAASVAPDIIEGDLPVGHPFDGTSDRASKFDLYQVANLTISSLASGGSETEALILNSLEDALKARGYPGTRIIFLSEAEALDESCSPDGTVEVRISRIPDQAAGGVVVASEHWFSRGKTGLEQADRNESVAKDCQPISPESTAATK